MTTARIAQCIHCRNTTALVDGFLCLVCAETLGPKSMERRKAFRDHRARTRPEKTDAEVLDEAVRRARLEKREHERERAAEQRQREKAHVAGLMAKLRKRFGDEDWARPLLRCNEFWLVLLWFIEDDAVRWLHNQPSQHLLWKPEKKAPGAAQPVVAFTGPAAERWRRRLEGGDQLGVTVKEVFD